MDAQTDFARASLKTSTYNQYRGLWKRFCDLAAARGLSPLPAGAAEFETLLCDFAAHSASAASSQKLVSAVAFFHRYYGFEPPASAARGKLILRGIKRTYMKPVSRANPLTREIVKSAIYYCIGSDLHLRANFTVSLATWRTVAQLVVSFAALARYHCMANISMKKVRGLVISKLF